MTGPTVAETIRDAYKAFNSGDIDAVLGLLDERVELRPAPSSLEPQPRLGREAVGEYLSPDLFDEQTAEPLEIIERGDRVLVVAQVRARGRESGAEVDQTVFHLWTIRDERAVRFEVLLNREQAFAALGEGSG
jgi:ketosteroid isomerase-like protein